MAKAGSKTGAKRAKAGRKRAATASHLQVAHRIEVLLRTMRAIERHEEQLCVVMTEIRSAGTLSAGVQKELQVLLEELPGDVFQADLNAVERALAAAAERTVKAIPAGGKEKKRVPMQTKQRRA